MCDSCDCDESVRLPVRMKCHKCGRSESVARDDSDPPGTAEVWTLCPECCGGDFAEVMYFDRDGKQILEF